MADFATDEQMALKQVIDSQVAIQHPAISSNRIVVDNLEPSIPQVILDKDGEITNTVIRTINAEIQLQNLTVVNDINYSNYRVQRTLFDDMDIEILQYKFTMFGNVNTFYPLPFKFSTDDLKKLTLYRNITDDISIFAMASLQPGGMFMQLVGSSEVFRLARREDVGTTCAALLNEKLYSSYNTDPKSFDCDETSGVYIRGGINYTLLVDSASIMLDTMEFITNGIQSNWSWGLYVAESIPSVNIEAIEATNTYVDDNYLEGR